jgi:hypothetical protein
VNRWLAGVLCGDSLSARFDCAPWYQANAQTSKNQRRSNQASQGKCPAAMRMAVEPGEMHATEARMLTGVAAKKSAEPLRTDSDRKLHYPSQKGRFLPHRQLDAGRLFIWIPRSPEAKAAGAREAFAGFPLGSCITPS